MAAGAHLSEDTCRVLIADDHPAIVETVARYLGEVEGIELVGRAEDGEHALRLIGDRRPNVCLLDLRMPKLDGIEVLRQLARVTDAPAVLLYTGYRERSLLLEALDVGARGFLLKESPLPDLVRAVRTVAGGGLYIDPVLAGLVAGAEATARLGSLTKREREILRLIADGMRDEQVGATLSISPLTVRTHVKHAMEKLEADTRTQAVAAALRESLIA